MSRNNQIKNEKGFTVIELVLSFVFVMFLAVGMFAVVNNYRNKQQKESINRELTKFTTGLTQIIYEDINKKKVKEIDYCKKGEDIEKQCINITFEDGDIKTLKVIWEEVSDPSIEGTNFKYEEFSVIYDNVKYKNHVPKFAKIVSDYMLTYSTEEDYLEYGKLYKIELRIAHQDIEDEFKVEIITTGSKKSS